MLIIVHCVYIWIRFNDVLQHDKVASLLSKYIGKPPSQIESLASVVGSTLDLSLGCSTNQGIIGSPPLNLNLTSPALAYQIQEIPEREKKLMADIAASAMEELVSLFQIGEPLWVKSTADGRYFLSRDDYDKLFPKVNQFKTSGAHVESSKDSGLVAISAATLVDMFLDSVSSITHSFIIFPIYTEKVILHCWNDQTRSRKTIYFCRINGKNSFPQSLRKQRQLKYSKVE